MGGGIQANTDTVRTSAGAGAYDELVNYAAFTGDCSLYCRVLVMWNKIGDRLHIGSYKSQI